jgi:hypothetical protein
MKMVSNLMPHDIMQFDEVHCRQSVWLLWYKKTKTSSYAFAGVALENIPRD